MIEEDLDTAIAAQALRERTSKAAIVRRHLRWAMRLFPPLQDDPLWQMAGASSFEPADIDEVVYE